MNLATLNNIFHKLNSTTLNSIFHKLNSTTLNNAFYKLNRFLVVIPFLLLTFIYGMVTYAHLKLEYWPLFFRPEPQAIPLMPIMHIGRILVITTIISVFLTPFTFFIEAKNPARDVQIAVGLYLIGLLSCIGFIVYNHGVFLSWLLN